MMTIEIIAYFHKHLYGKQQTDENQSNAFQENFSLAIDDTFMRKAITVCELNPSGKCYLLPPPPVIFILK